MYQETTFPSRNEAPGISSNLAEDSNLPRSLPTLLASSMSTLLARTDSESSDQGLALQLALEATLPPALSSSSISTTSSSDKSKYDAWFRAARQQSTPALMENAPPDPNVRDSRGRTALHLAVSRRHASAKEAIAYLVSLGIDVFIRDDSGKLAVEWACRVGHLEDVKYLLEEMEKVSQGMIEPSDRASWMQAAKESGRGDVVAFLKGLSGSSDQLAKRRGSLNWLWKKDGASSTRRRPSFMKLKSGHHSIHRSLPNSLNIRLAEMNVLSWPNENRTYSWHPNKTNTEEIEKDERFQLTIHELTLSDKESLHRGLSLHVLLTSSSGTVLAQHTTTLNSDSATLEGSISVFIGEMWPLEGDLSDDYPTQWNESIDYCHIQLVSSEFKVLSTLQIPMQSSQLTWFVMRPIVSEEQAKLNSRHSRRRSSIMKSQPLASNASPAGSTGPATPRRSSVVAFMQTMRQSIQGARSVPLLAGSDQEGSSQGIQKQQQPVTGILHLLLGIESNRFLTNESNTKVEDEALLTLEISQSSIIYSLQVDQAHFIAQILDANGSPITDQEILTFKDQSHTFLLTSQQWQYSRLLIQVRINNSNLGEATLDFSNYFNPSSSMQVFSVALPVHCDLVENPLGSLKLSLQYEEEDLLPESVFEPSSEYCLSKAAEMLEFLCLKKDYRPLLVAPLVRFYTSQLQIIKILKFLLSVEISSTGESTTLFRANSLATKALDYYMKMGFGKSYLFQVVQPLLNELKQDSFESCEVNPINVSDAETLEQNKKRLLSYLNTFFDLFCQTSLPHSWRVLFFSLQAMVTERFPELAQSSNTTIGAFLCLRLICPSLLAPRLFGLQFTFSPLQQRTLTLVAKAIQTLANGSGSEGSFIEKESYMQEIHQQTQIKWREPFLHFIQQEAMCDDEELFSPEERKAFEGMNGRVALTRWVSALRSAPWFDQDENDNVFESLFQLIDS